jgi:hypothetical protein
MNIPLDQAWLIVFVLVDDNGIEVAGLGTSFSVAISKNGGDLIAGTGLKAEIGSGYYSYELTAGETDTAGPLAIRVTGAGVVQQNLVYRVSGTAWEPGVGTYTLTPTEASTVLRCAEDDPNMLMLLPLVDTYLANATGIDWAEDPDEIPLEMWHENPAMIGMPGSSLGFGLAAVLMQLKALALQLEEEESA